MRAVSAAWPVIVANTHPMRTEIESWLGGVQLLGRVPLERAKIAYDDTATVKRRLTLTVPAEVDGVRLDPGPDPGAPLASYGQRLYVRTGIGLPNGSPELVSHGWYLITGWRRNEEAGTIGVEAADLAQLIVDDRLTAPSSPPPGATFVSEFTRLVAGILPVVVEAGLADAAIGASSRVWERDRDAALSDLCTSWPARWWVGDDGAVHVGPVHPPVVAGAETVALTDGRTGTVTGRSRQAQRGAIYNVIVVDGRVADDGTAGPHAVAQVTDAASPIRAAGPYGRVTRFYASDLITTQPQAQACADSMLVTYSTAGRVEGVDAVPDPALELGDVARVYTTDGDAYTGRITALTLPLTVDDGPMQVTIGYEPGGVE